MTKIIRRDGRKSKWAIAPERFWPRVNKNGPVPEHVPHLGQCWIWKGSLNNLGYPRFCWDFTDSYAHRYSWIIHYGATPDGLCALHKCDNPMCVRPDHLFLGTKLQNTSDMMRKGRHKCGKLRGEDNPRSKLTLKDVIYIKSSKERGIDLAAKFGVYPTLISGIRLGLRWRHVL